MKVISDKYEFVSDCPKGYRLHNELLCGKQEFYFIDHPQCDVVVSVCLSVCHTITFESCDVGSLYLHIRYISR